mmetsp:Transcript_48078/g.119032  ORF Transcript_48078/g.119032 Transcript_48078/m.119032 type:complete len:161 (+) Transcript_48078:497-979(+)
MGHTTRSCMRAGILWGLTQEFPLNAGVRENEVPRPVSAPATSTALQSMPHDEKVSLMRQLAEDLGFTPVENGKLATHLGQAIMRRLRSRSEQNFQYQSVAFNITNFPRSYAQKIFPVASVTTNADAVQTWRLETMGVVSTTFDWILQLSGETCSGCCRGI